MTTIDNTGRPAFMYDEDTETWYAISGRISTAANYVWTGANEWQNNSFFTGNIVAKNKINSFLNPAARTSAIPSPGTGLITFLEQDALGNTINRFEFWNGSSWVVMADLTSVQTFTNKTLTSPEINNPTTTGTINAQSASVTAYTIALSDRDELVELSSASATTVTVPADSTTNFPIGSNVSLLQTGTGQVTVAGAVGVTVNSNPGLKLSGQWAAASLIKRAANTWILIGNTAT